MSKKGKILRLVFIVIAFIYIALIVKYLILRSGIRLSSRQFRLEPFRMLKDYLSGNRSLAYLMLNYAGNIAIFVPFGMLVPGIFKKIKFFGVLLAGIITILLIETVQYFTLSGFADVDDVIMNFIGVVIGSGLYLGIFGGAKRKEISYILSLFFIAIIGIAAVFCVRTYRPDLLPQKITVNGKMISGIDAESYDIRIPCYKISHGDIFTSKDKAKDRDGNDIKDAKGSYHFSDTVVFAVAENRDDVKTYKITSIEYIIKAVADTDHLYARLWLDNKGECRMVVIELK